MTVYDRISTKVKQLPESFAEEVSDFVDFLLAKSAASQDITGEAGLAEAGMSVYLRDLEDYEERLARGEIQW